MEKMQRERGNWSAISGNHTFPSCLALGETFWQTFHATHRLNSAALTTNVFALQIWLHLKGYKQFFFQWCKIYSPPKKEALLEQIHNRPGFYTVLCYVYIQGTNTDPNIPKQNTELNLRENICSHAWKHLLEQCKVRDVWPSSQPAHLRGSHARRMGESSALLWRRARYLTSPWECPPSGEMNGHQHNPLSAHVSWYPQNTHLFFKCEKPRMNETCFLVLSPAVQALQGRWVNYPVAAAAWRWACLLPVANHGWSDVG